MTVNLTTLDFFDIRESIKSYLKTRTEFSDYNFEGSTLSYLIDVLAYNTQYSAFYGNLAANELFLDTATVRDNIIKIAKLLNYTPRSRQSAAARISFAFQTEIGPDGEYPTTLTLSKGPVFSSSVGNNEGFIFNVLNDITTTVNQVTGRAQFVGVTIYEGTILNYRFFVDSNNTERYIIPNSGVDTRTLKVFVRPSIQSSRRDQYRIADSLQAIGPDQKVYFLQEVEDQRYEIFFGDSKTGRKLIDGEVIDVEYLISNGEEANGCQRMTFIGTVTDSFGRRPIKPPVIKLLNRAQGGERQESIEQIKFNAPKFYATQARAVTAKDYESLTRIVYPQTDIVSVTGGERLSPPQYGKVFVTIKNKNNTPINALTRRRIVNDLKKYAVASTTIEVLDAKRYFLDTRMSVRYDNTRTSKNQQEIYNLLSNRLYQFGQQNFNKFGGTLNYSKVVKYLDDSDPSITSINLQVRLRQSLTANKNQNQTYCFDFGVPLRDPLDCLDTNLKSSLFNITGFANTVELEDDNKGNIRLFYIQNGQKIYLNDRIGFIDYKTGKLCIGPINISRPNTVLISVIPKDPTVNFPFDTIPEIGFPTVIDVFSNTTTDAGLPTDWTPPPLQSNGSGSGGTNDGTGGPGGSGTGDASGVIAGAAGFGTGAGDGGVGTAGAGAGAGTIGAGTGGTGLTTDSIPDSFFENEVSYDTFADIPEDNCFS
jgi:hypothetical protein